MKQLLLIGCMLFIGATFTTCTDKDPAEQRPAILGVSFEGIPDANVDFNPAISRITVKLPAVMEQGLRPVFRVTEGTRVLDGVMNDNTIDISSYCACGSAPAPIILKVGDDRTTSTYELKLVSEGTVKPRETNEQATFSLKTKKLELSLPVENLYSNISFSTLHLTNLATGVTSPVFVPGSCIAGCSAGAPGRLRIVLYSPIEHTVKPGTYSIQVDNLKFSQKLVVTE